MRLPRLWWHPGAKHDHLPSVFGWGGNVSEECTKCRHPSGVRAEVQRGELRQLGGLAADGRLCRGNWNRGGQHQVPGWMAGRVAFLAGRAFAIEDPGMRRDSPCRESAISGFVAASLVS